MGSATFLYISTIPIITTLYYIVKFTGFSHYIFLSRLFVHYQYGLFPRESRTELI